MTFASKREDLIKECVSYMRTVGEGSASSEGLIILPSSNIKGAFIHYFQNPDLFKEYGDIAPALRDSIVSLLDVPSLMSDKIISGGSVSMAILEQMVDEIAAGKLRAEDYKKWISQTYQVCINYIEGYARYFYGGQPEPEIPSMLSATVFLNIRNKISTPPAVGSDFADFKVETLGQQSNKWTPKWGDTSHLQQHMPDLKEQKLLPKRQTKIFNFFKEASLLAKDPATPLAKKTKYLKKVDAKLEKYKDEKQLTPAKADEIHSNLENILKLKK